MDISNQIRSRREAMGLSQDDLAARVYVSRQTISSWERDRTYPDVQSLLLLSEVFGASLDTLVKGDVDVMDEIIERDRKLRWRIAVAQWVIWALLLVLVRLFFLTPLFDEGVSEVQDIARLAMVSVATLGLTVVMLVLGLKDKAILDKHDIKTYRELRAFQRGERVDRDPALRARRSIIDSLWMPSQKVVIGGTVLAAILGLALGLALTML